MDNDSDGPCPMLRLPRELRDEIWRYAVVRPKVFVSFGRLDDLQRRGPCPNRPLRTCMQWENEDADHGGKVYQSGTYFRPHTFEDFWNKDSDEEDGEVDYDKLALGYPTLNVGHDENKHPDLSIFLTCRQVSAETMEMYYAENKFIFCLINFGSSDCSMTSANAACSFLGDRPTALLSQIRHIDLYIYGWCDYDGFQVLDPQVWQSLMSIIKPNMKLYQLSLHFRGRLADLRDDANAESWVTPSEEDLTQNARITELTQLPKVSRLTTHFYGFREPRHSLADHKHRLACFTAPSHPVCYHADSALQFAALVKVLRSNLLRNGKLLGSKNVRAQLMREPELVANDIENQVTDIRPDKDFNYSLTIQTDDDGAGNCLLPQQHPKPTSDEDGTDQAYEDVIDIFEPLGCSASLDRIQTRGRRYY